MAATVLLKMSFGFSVFGNVFFHILSWDDKVVTMEEPSALRMRSLILIALPVGDGKEKDHFIVNSLYIPSVGASSFSSWMRCTRSATRNWLRSRSLYSSGRSAEPGTRT